jgi:hypothetical protein
MYGKVILHLPTISCIKASLHHMVELKLEDIHVIREYPNVFPNELPGMPPDRAIEFKIELQLIFFFPNGFVFGMVTPLHFTHLVAIIPCDFL